MHHEFHSSRRTTVLLLLGAVVFVLLGGWMTGLFVSPPDPWRIPEGVVVATGWIGIVFFGACAVFLVVRLASPRAAVTVDDEGIVDRSSMLAGGTIAWREISGCEVVEMAGQRFLGLRLHDVEGFLARQPQVKRKGMSANQARFGCVVNIPANAVADFEGLVRVVAERGESS